MRSSTFSLTVSTYVRPLMRTPSGWIPDAVFFAGLAGDPRDFFDDFQRPSVTCPTFVVLAVPLRPPASGGLLVRTDFQQSRLVMNS